MSYQTGRDGGVTPAQPAAPALSTWRFWVIAVAVVVIVVVPVGFEITIHLVTPDAVHVTASSVSNGHLVFAREITNSHVVADLYARINSLPPAPENAVFHCPVPGPFTYDFSFTRWGMVVEDAQPGIGCVFLWNVSRGGIPSGRMGSVGDTIAILSEAQLPQ